jgi:hypothetical protein
LPGGAGCRRCGEGGGARFHSTGEHAAVLRDPLSDAKVDTFSRALGHRRQKSPENHQTLAFIAPRGMGNGNKQARERERRKVSGPGHVGTYSHALRNLARSERIGRSQNGCSVCPNSIQALFSNWE